ATASETSIAPRSWMNSEVSTEIDAPVSRSGVLSRLPARELEATQPVSVSELTTNGLSSIVSPAVSAVVLFEGADCAGRDPARTKGRPAAAVRSVRSEWRFIVGWWLDIPIG